MSNAITFDLAAHTNPAFCLACARWMAQGYSDMAEERGWSETRMSLVWAISGLALLGPIDARSLLPKTASKRLSNLMREYSASIPSLVPVMRPWVEPFWAGLLLGIGTGTMSISDGRLRVIGQMKSPATVSARDLCKKAIALGKILAKEGDDITIATILGVAVEP